MKKELIKRIFSSIILIPLALFFIIKGSFYFNLFILACLLITSYEWHMISKRKKYYYLGYIFLIFSFYCVYLLRLGPETESTLLFLFITLICVSTDIGGYSFGKLLKGPKLTKLSPNKTYSGMIGGYFLSIILTFIFIKLTYSYEFSFKVFTMKVLYIVILISSISQIGDIIISYFKRLAKMKDTGKIIPGHGGLLDRIDGMIFEFPTAYLILKVL